jgi:hypothetical protein
VSRPSRLRLARLLLTLAAFITASMLWNLGHPRQDVELAVAKGKNMLDMPGAMMGLGAAYLVDEAAIDTLVRADPAAGQLLRGKDLAYLSAVAMTPGEARYWESDGCADTTCVQVTYYDYTNGGTVQAVVNPQTSAVVGSWTNAAARPGGSSEVLPEAMAIAAADPQVRAILGDIGAADPAMIPMSGWLMDDACREDWCVDLTFHDPAGTGRVFHVFVNLETSEVARTFYTRSRPDRSAAKPLEQRNAFTDGCHEQYGWNVCWEMTAHDGINFRDVTFEDQSIFTSAKIGQIEAWYPSWPGGYRDEIGFAATVPPFGDTVINDLGDGFEVRQIFTEFTRWPNCICCYRYEEVMRFYGDGRFEPRFISHGPGCDDLSVYRPFWRIDLALDGPQGDEVWLFDGAQWIEQDVEFETSPFVEGLSPEGDKLATFNGDLHYRWSMERTDPLGLDEAYVFMLANNPLEGEDPIVTGPGDTFIPPRQWINGDPLSGEDVVLWYVPLLKTKKGGPWWCMPDPEPEFSPCEAVLVARPAGALQQPTAEELAALQVLATATSVAPAAEFPAPTATPRPIEGDDAPTIIQNAGCTACHQIGELGEAHKVGPDLSDVGLTAGGRVPGMTAEAYLHQSIVQPNAYLAPECPNGPCMPNIMPRDYAARLRPEQIDTVVAYLLAQDGAEPTRAPIGTGIDAETTAAPKASVAPKAVPPAQPAVTPAIGLQLVVITVLAGLGLFLMLRK